LPESHASISGGNLYNAALLEALQEQHAVKATSFDAFRADPEADGTFLIDSLNLVDFHELGGATSARQRHVLLVHHLPSLEPGLPADDPALVLEPKVLASVDAFVCTSRFTEDYLRSKGLRQPMLTIEPVVIPPPIDDRPLDQPVSALMSCNLITRKGVLAFLQTLAAGTRSADEYQLDLVGRHDLEPEYGAACQECVRSSPSLASRVTLRGEVAFASMSTWYQEANLFISASRMETFGISLQEARAYGLPILAVQGGNSENHLIEGVTGELYSDPAKLAEGFLALARDPKTFASYLRSAQDRRPADRGDWSDAAEQLAKSIESWFS
jgi:glycosyltransferase involved in cell wall biosynthesis